MKRLIFVLAASLICAKGLKTVVKIEPVVIMNAEPTAKVTLKAEDIEQAIISNKPLESDAIFESCVFTNRKDGSFNITANASGNKYKKGNKFALYNKSLGKVKADLVISSNQHQANKTLKPGKTVTLGKKFSDPNAQGMKCANKIKGKLLIAADEVKNASAGTYTAAVAMSVEPIR